MKLGCAACVLLCILVVATDSVGARKGRKNKKSPPKWRGASMPGNNKRLQSLSESDQLQLDCRAGGKPKPIVTWFKNGLPVEPSDHVTFRKHRLIVANAKVTDSGNYTCTAANKFGQIDWSFIVDVSRKNWPMEIVGPLPENITAVVGSDVEFQCEVINDNMANIRWQKLELDERGNVTKGDGVFLQSSGYGILRLENVQKSDEGVYACLGSNYKGMKMSRGYLKVIDPIISPDVGSSDDGASGSRSGKARNNIRNRNNQESSWYPAIYGGSVPDLLDENDPLVHYTAGTSSYQPDFGPYVPPTTRKPRNRNRNKNKGRKNKKNGKNKKDKSKKKMRTTPHYVVERSSTTSTTTRRTTSTTTTKVPTPYDPYRSTTFTLWNFGNKDNDFDGVSDTRYNHGSQQPTDERGRSGAAGDEGKSFEEGNTANAKENGKNGREENGDTRVWTIYTVVGGVCGVILLIGLVAITLTLCCKQEEEGVYKSATPV